jgi:type IV pilus assembly protein PilY1
MNRKHPIGALLVALILACTGIAQADDTALFSVNVPPNVLLVVDNSGSMNELVWHPDYNQALTYSCNTTNGGFTSNQQFSSASQTWTRCGRTRTFYSDPAVTAAGNSTRVSFGYLNWVFSLPNGDPRLAEINALGNGSYSTCLQSLGFTTYSKYRRARVTAAKDVLREVICNVNQAGAVRFGIAEFRLPGGSGDPNGGYVRVPIKDWNTLPYLISGITGARTHQQHIDLAINALEGESWTPLGETLFTLYTYFMARGSTATNRPLGVNGTTRFPAYVYRPNQSGNYGSFTSTASEIPEDPVQYDCQKNFIVMITDGEPTKDDFDNSNSSDNTAQGYASFLNLIGDYHADGEVEVSCAQYPGVAAGDECASYLDDVAKFMQNTDFRPDRAGTQVIDVYTVGFTTTPSANDLLSRTAQNGNGQFYFSNNAEELADAITGAITDIINKSQSFTAATVPATRTSDGGNIYTSLFLPRNADPYWEGHLSLFHITAGGGILDANGNCALIGAGPGCTNGPLSQTAVPFWDAGEEIPDPAARTLFTTMPSGGTSTLVDFDVTLGVSALGDPASALDDLTFADRFLYPVGTATTAEVLADQIIQNVRGCEFGTGVGNTCVRRPWLLGDIFHSNPLVVGDPRSFIPEPSYFVFAANHATRDKAIYAGANDGFLHAFHGGTWDPSPPTGPPGYDRGTGVEQFGFMPWPARRNVRHLPKDTGSRDYYFVDGTPVAADLWLPPSPTQTTKANDGSEWKTVLAGGLRQGGNAYYALDVTDPADPGYPGYLWEFPAEGAPASIMAYMGETWGTPILTRVKVVISGQVYERAVAIVSGGYHASGDPNDPLNYAATATAGRAVFLVDVGTGEVLAEKKFQPLLLGDPQSEMLYAVATTPAVYDLDGDDFADVIYFGDLGGNLWKWVIAHDPLSGNVGEDPIHSTGDVSQPNWKFEKFFQATPTPTSPHGVLLGTTWYFKSIYFPPAATFSNDDLWLSFATGERANLPLQGVTTSTAENNRFYSVMDPDPLGRQGTIGGAPLTEQTLFDATGDGTCSSMTGFDGYFFRARDSEKFVTNVDIFAYYVIAASYTPAAAGGDPCSAAGSATLYVFRVDCGQGFFSGTGDASRRLELGAGMPTDPRVTVDPSGSRVIVTQQDGEIDGGGGPPPPSNKIGQLYWRVVLGD